MTHTWVHDDDTIVTLTIDGEIIETTPWHPFFTDEGWEDAGDLEVGDLVLSLDGDYGTVDAVLVEDRTETMYDLTVDVVHTFAVGDGAWVVHNCGGEGGGRGFYDAEDLPIPDNIRTIDHQLEIIIDLDRYNRLGQGEKAYLLDASGNVTGHKAGGTSSVALTVPEWRSIEGGFFFHNHPKGYPLSTQDIANASLFNVNTIAVGKNGDVFAATRLTQNGRFPILEQIDLMRANSRFTAQMNRAGISDEYMRRHLFLIELSRNYGFKYIRSNFSSLIDP